jgi:hypothetical protein
VTPLLTDGVLESVNVRFNETEQWLVLERGPITVACNLAARPRELDLPAGRQQLQLRSQAEVPVANGKVTLPPDSVAVLKRG